MRSYASHAAPASPATPSSRTTREVVATLVPFLKPYWGRIALALLCLVAAKLAGLSVPLVLKHLVDGLNLPKNPESLALVLPVGLLLAYGGARLAERVFTEARQLVFARVLARSSRTVMLKVFRHLHALSLRFHLDRQTGGISRDVERGGKSISDLLDWTLG